MADNKDIQKNNYYFIKISDNESQDILLVNNLNLVMF